MTKDEAKKRIDELKAKYPLAISAQQAESAKHDDHYCVGGALCRGLMHELNFNNASDYAFPNHHVLAEALKTYNNDLPARIAAMFAQDIIIKNELNYIENAWETAKHAFEYPNDNHSNMGKIAGEFLKERYPDA